MGVRRSHFVLFVLVSIVTFLYLSYLNYTQLELTATSVTSSNVGIFQINAGQTNINIVASGIHNGNSEGFVGALLYETTNNPSNNSQGQHIKGGKVTGMIYEDGHINVSSKICADLGKNIKLVVIVISAASHYTARLAIRDTWGHSTRKDIVIAFMLGRSLNENLNRKIEQEQQLYDDVIIGKFVDTYDNLSLKTISMLEWVSSYCPRALFVLKTDDDMFINVSKLLDFIANHTPEQRAMYGDVAKNWEPVRNKKSKYYISPQEYNMSIFPDFVVGTAYLFPAQISEELYLTALNYRYLKLEDVFITGIVAGDLGIERIHVSGFLNTIVYLTRYNIHKMISLHMVNTFEQYSLWKTLHDKLK